MMAAVRLHDPGTVARYRAMGAWTDDLIDDLFRSRVAAAPQRLAIVDPPNRPDLIGTPARALTWSELDDEVWRLAAVLHAEGVRAGDVVAYQLPNTAEIAATFLAVVRLGAVVCPFPVQYRAREIETLGAQSDARHLVTMTRIGPRAAAVEAVAVAARSPGLRSVLAFGPDPPPGVTALDQRLAGAERSAVEDYVAGLAPDPNDCVSICWTSGTESAPKGVLRAHCDWLAMCTGTVEGPQLTGDDVLLNPFPTVNMAGISGTFLPWLQVGGTLVQHHPFDLPTFLRQIAEWKVTYTVAPPALLMQLLRAGDLPPGTDLSSLRVIGSGSAPLTPDLVRGWRDRFGIDIINFYGSNEGVSLLGLPGDIPDPAERAVFFPRYGAPGRRWSFRLAGWTEVRVVDPEGGSEITEAGVPGELRIRGPAVMAGYLPASGAVDPFDEEGFLRSGDLVEIAGDAGQYLRYAGRIKDVVVRGGMKVSAAEVEDLIASHPAVAEVAVVGYPDEILGERAAAVVVPRPGAVVTLEGLVTHLDALGVATFKRPERLLVVERLPRNALGKVQKGELRAALGR
jgi:acyl-CoA synthetase